MEEHPFAALDRLYSMSPVAQMINAKMQDVASGSAPVSADIRCRTDPTTNLNPTLLSLSKSQSSVEDNMEVEDDFVYQSPPPKPFSFQTFQRLKAAAVKPQNSRQGTGQKGIDEAAKRDKENQPSAAQEQGPHRLRRTDRGRQGRLRGKQAPSVVAEREAEPEPEPRRAVPVPDTENCDVRKEEHEEESDENIEEKDESEEEYEAPRRRSQDRHRQHSAKLEEYTNRERKLHQVHQQRATRQRDPAWKSKGLRRELAGLLEHVPERTKQRAQQQRQLASQQGTPENRTRERRTRRQQKPEYKEPSTSSSSSDSEDEENEIRERHRNSRRHQQTAAKPEDNPGKQRLKDHVRPVQNKKAPQRPAQKVQQKQAASERRKRKKVQYQERNSSDSDSTQEPASTAEDDTRETATLDSDDDDDDDEATPAANPPQAKHPPSKTVESEDEEEEEDGDDGDEDATPVANQGPNRHSEDEGRKDEGQKPATRSRPQSSVSEIEMDEWALRPSSKGVCLEGHRLCDPEGIYWTSTAIVARLSSCLVATGSGRRYRLIGPMAKEQSLAVGISKPLCKAFAHGFPPNWKQRLTNHGLSESNPVSMKTPKVQRPMSIVQQRNKGNAPMKKKKNPAVDDNVGKQRKNMLDLKDLPRTRSGRLVKPQLAWWANQRVKVHSATDSILIEPGTPTANLLGIPMHTFREDKRTKSRIKNSVEQLKLNHSLRKSLNKTASSTASEVTSATEMDTQDTNDPEEQPNSTLDSDSGQPEAARRTSQLAALVTNSDTPVAMATAASRREKLYGRNLACTLGLMDHGATPRSSLSAGPKPRTAQDTASLRSPAKESKRDPEVIDLSHDILTVLKDHRARRLAKKPAKTACYNQSPSPRKLKHRERRRPSAMDIDVLSQDEDCDLPTVKARRPMRKSIVERCENTDEDVLSQDRESNLQGKDRISHVDKDNKKQSSEPSQGQWHRGHPEGQKLFTGNPRVESGDESSDTSLVEQRQGQGGLKATEITESDDEDDFESAEPSLAQHHRSQNCRKGMQAAETDDDEGCREPQRAQQHQERGHPKHIQSAESDSEGSTASAEPTQAQEHRGQGRDKGKCANESDDEGPTESLGVQQRRGRGRPRRHQVNESDDEGPSEPRARQHQKRGRPRNRQVDESDGGSTKPSRAQQQRGRGRPRKSSEVDEISDEGSREPSRTKQQQGHPRNRQVSDSDDEGSTKPLRTQRGRGRPGSRQVNYVEESDDEGSTSRGQKHRRQGRSSKAQQRRGRGRPKKQQDSGSDDEWSTVGSKLQRHRDRPESRQVDESDGESSTEPSKARQHRGRPRNRKVDTSDEEEPSDQLPVRHPGRGRPKENRDEKVLQKKNHKSRKSRYDDKKKKGGRPEKPSEDHDFTEISPISKIPPAVVEEETEGPRPWSNEELCRFRIAFSKVEPTDFDMWDKISKEVRTRSAQECQDFHFQPLNSAKMPKKSKSRVIKEKVTKPSQLTGGKGTMKRRRQLRELVENHNGGYTDDFFDSTPFKKKSLKVPNIGDSLNELFPTNPGFQTPGQGTPMVRHNWMPASEKKTPHCSMATPGLLKSVDRTAMDGYVHQLMRRRHGRRFQDQVRMSTVMEQEPPAVPKAPEVDVAIFEAQPAADQDIDSEEEMDYYFSEDEG